MLLWSILKLKIKKDKINILTSYKEKFKSIRFKLDTITEGYLLKKKKVLIPISFVNALIIYQLDKDNKVICCYLNSKTEKFIF